MGLAFEPSRFRRWADWVQGQVEKPWYPLLLFWAAFLDVWLVVIPTDGLVIVSTLAQPKRWKSFALFFTLGSSMGALILAWLVSNYGLAIIQEHFPGFISSDFWKVTESWVDSIGLWAVFLIAGTPLSQQPAVILAALSHHTVFNIFLVVLVGRALKYAGIGYLCRWAPEQLAPLAKLLGFKKELGKFASLKDSSKNKK